MTTTPESDRLCDGLFELEPTTVRCPYPAYAKAREAAPFWVERLHAYMVTRYEDVVAVLRDAEQFSSAMASGPSSVTPLARRISEDPAASDELRRRVLRRLEISKSAVLLFSDPPDHIRQRKLVNKGFTPRRIAQLEDEVKVIAEKVVDAFVDAGHVELMTQFAMQLPMTVIANILGVPKEMMDTFKWWSDSFTAGTGNLGLSTEELEDMFAAVDQFYDYFTEQVTDRQANPRDDLLTDIVSARLDGEKPLELNEILQMLVQFLIAGNETTTNLLGSIMLMLVSKPDLMAQMRADPSQVRALVEEVLRLESPVQGLFRIATKDVEIGGTAIPAGSLMWMVYGSANRDPHGFSAGDQVSLEDALTRQHLAFGKGEHYCLGAPLARMEARIGTEVLLSRLDDIALGCADDEVQYLPNFVLHGLKSLPLTFTKAP